MVKTKNKFVPIPYPQGYSDLKLAALKTGEKVICVHGADWAKLNRCFEFLLHKDGMLAQVTDQRVKDILRTLLEYPETMLEQCDVDLMISQCLALDQFFH